MSDIKASEMIARIRKYAHNNGNAIAVSARHRSYQIEKLLNESTIQGLKKVYLVELGYIANGCVSKQSSKGIS